METKKIANKSAMAIRDAIEELIIQKHGISSRILTDNGLEFNNNPCWELAQRYNLSWKFSSPRHHETVGAVERANQTLTGILKKLTSFGTTDWGEELEKATFAYNISFHRAINTSPFILKYGKRPTLNTEDFPETEELARDELMKQREDHFERYKKCIEKGKRTVPYNLKIGDRVLIYNRPLSAKLDSGIQSNRTCPSGRLHS